MAVHITGTSATSISTTVPGVAVRGIRLTVNAALTGTYTVTDQTGTIAVITNPAVGGSFVYSGLTSPVTVTASATGDATVSILNVRN